MAYRPKAANIPADKYAALTIYTPKTFKDMLCPVGTTCL